MKKALKNDFQEFMSIAKSFLAVSGAVFWLLIFSLIFVGGY
ncbi:hypothetical protein [Bacillus velezensis]|nr:hypothetical protein [Bacillus velezensis]